MTPERCLGLSMQLIDIIEYFLETGNINLALEYQVYLIALILLLIECGQDPRNALDTISKTLRHDVHQSIDDSHFESLLIATAHIIRSIAPFYLRDVLELVKVIAKNQMNNFNFNAIIINPIQFISICRFCLSEKWWEIL